MREVGIIVRRSMSMAALILGIGCASSMTPEQKAVHEIFVEVSHQCQSRYHTIHVDLVDLEGGLKLHSDADSRSEYRAYVACYVDGLKARAEARRKSGLSVPFTVRAP